MLLGIDVGGTHTDVVIIAATGVVDAAKVPTDPRDLLASIRQALSQVAPALAATPPERFALSTTLCTNALVQGQTDPVGMVLFGGPGIDPGHYAVGQQYAVLR
ncbi:MAG: hydantoinase/oxoprolinase N-terminal domain-containing protein, partial [Thermodesulfobacteriota bacterium]